MLRFGTSGLVAVLLAALAGCSPDYSPNTYGSSAVQQANKVEQGVVVGVRGVGINASGATGAVTGAAAGGIVGSQTPGGGLGTAFGALGGTVIGGLVGSTIEHSTADTLAFEYVVRKTNGELLSVTQRDPAPLDIGQHVLVIAGSQARIVADYTVPVTPEPPTAERMPTAPSLLPPMPAPLPAGNPPPVNPAPVSPAPVDLTPGAADHKPGEAAQ